MKTGLRVTGLVLMATAVAVAEMRTWTFEQSGKNLRGEVVGFAGDSVKLRGPDGKNFSVPIAYLTESNRQYLEAERAKQWKEVEVVKLEGVELAGRYKKCMVNGPGVNGAIFIDRLPLPVETILNDRKKQTDQINALLGQIESENRAVQQVNAAAATGPSNNRGYRYVTRMERAEANAASKDVKSLRDNATKLQKAYDDSVQKTKAQTMVKMKNSGMVYKGLAVWECFDARTEKQ